MSAQRLVVASENPGVGRFVDLVQRALADAGTDCVQIGSWERHADQPNMDVDIAVTTRDWKAARDAITSLSGSGFRCMRRFRSGVLQTRWDFLVTEGELATVVGIDLSMGVPVGGLPALWYDEVWSVASRLGTQGDRSATTMAVYRAVKYAARDAMPDAVEVSDGALAILGELGIAGLVGERATEDGDQRIQYAVRRRRRGLVCRALGRKPLQFLQDVIASSYRYPARILRPDGACIEVLGPDGSGKSSACEGSAELLRHGFRGVTLRHIGSTLVNRRRESTSEPHAQPAYSYPIGAVKVLYLSFNYGLGWLLGTYTLLVKGRCVIHDRGMLDVVADPARYRLRPLGVFASAFLRSAQRPLMVVILDTAPELVVARKGEIDLANATELRMRYLALNTGSAERFVVDGSLSIDEISNAVALHTFELVADRYQGVAR